MSILTAHYSSPAIANTDSVIGTERSATPLENSGARSFLPPTGEAPLGRFVMGKNGPGSAEKARYLLKWSAAYE